MYCSLRKITNVRGRVDYITNEKRQENIIAVASTVDNQKEFARTLAKESQQRFAEYNTNDKAKCVEAREFIIGLPNDFQEETYKEIAKLITENFKKKYDVDCISAIHCKNAKGQKNIHLHLLFSERPTLKVPEEQSEIRANRNLYYDKNNKRCKKSEAVRIVRKGDLIRKGYIRYFSDKITKFKSKEFVNEYKEYLSESLSMPKFDKSRHFATKHIGKHNPKKKYIEEYNDTVKQINYNLDEMEKKVPGVFKKKTPKQIFLSFVRQQKIKQLTTKALQSTFSVFMGIFRENFKEELKGQEIEEEM